ncbi:sodium-independent anion transporter [[Phormidium ambiguum] IAM M-71]|uniref:Sodium-independent anion transporter n=1 Tax=[Phormidium ambiguum] IAM M-71 TaxID=454136 RepID=A0A1U7IH66_9CYAN|nr:SulP family inorganic anion transporter [Phormidium ambiguum]OKH36446.1 sodium-independent anion transporter [Phormidium ambiguum IAM M-71]
MQLANRVTFNHLRGDLFGGITAAIVALPMALAFGVSSGAGAIAGLYGAAILGFFAALFGGTPTLISGPTGPMTVVMTAIVTSMTAKNPENGLAMAFTVVMLAGIFQILFGFLKLGKYVTLMPYTVISGFMSGIGVIMIILQVGPFFGQVNPKGGIIPVVTSIPTFIANLDPAETALATLTLALLFLTPKKVRRLVPPQLLALVIGTLIAAFVLQGSDLRLIGAIPTGLPKPQLPVFTFEQMTTMLVDGVMLGMLGCIDSLLTSVIADSITRTQHDSDKELIGQGIGNLLSGIFGGLPGAGATMGTVVNIQAGGKTVLSGMFHAVVLLVLVLGASGLTQFIPQAVLAGILVKVGIDIVDWNFLKRAHKLSWKAAAIMYGVLFLTVFVDLIVAVGVGVFIANILTIQRLSDIQSDEVKAITHADDETPLSYEEKLLFQEARGKILLLHLGGPMSFGAAKAISQRQAIMEDYKVVILDVSDVPILGVTATLALESLIAEATQKHLEVFIVGGTEKVKARLERFGILEKVPANNLSPSRLEALHQAVSSLKGVSGESYANKGSFPIEENGTTVEGKIDIDGTLTTK